jgi:hypothetical protein
MIEYRPMSEAPDRISGSFNVQQTLYSVSKKGKLTKLFVASDCTYSGDQKVVHNVDKTIPRIAVLTERFGNGAWDSIVYYK